MTFLLRILRVKRIVFSALAVCSMVTFVFMLGSYLRDSAKDSRYQYPYASGRKFQPVNETQSAPREILLVSYGRSGSSFLSALISGHPDVFFAFEPLYALNKKQKFSISYIGNSESDSVALVNAFLTCDIPVKYLFGLDSFLFKGWNSTRDIYDCLQVQTTGISHFRCVMEFLNSCRTHKVTFVKTIRFRVKWAENFLATNHNFKLLYLVRDPRATLFSQSNVLRNFNFKKEINKMSEIHCSMLEDDLKEAERLKRFFPGQVKALRYEEIVMDTYSYTKDVYNFLELQYNDVIASHIANITNARNDPPSYDIEYSVIRKNSSSAMNRWRHFASFNQVLEVDKICGHLYGKLGYKFVYSRDDLLRMKPLIVEPDRGGVFH